MSSSLFSNDWFLVLVVTPVLLGFLRSAFSSEIEYWVGAYTAYRLRPFDLDRDPRTHDWCYLRDDASGEWSVVSLTYRLSFSRGGNGVFVHYYDSDWDLLRVERVPFSEWGRRCKARLNVSNLPRGLDSAIRRVSGAPRV